MDYWDDPGKEKKGSQGPKTMVSLEGTLLNPKMNKSHHSYRLWSMLMTSKTSGFHSHAPIAPWGQ